MKAVELSHIYKSYKSVKALQDISFEVSKSELFGVIGADGAGKSTLFNILVTLVRADKGSATIEGFDVNVERNSIREIVGYMPDRFSLYQDLTVRENIDFYATIFNTTLEQSIDLISDIWKQIEPFSNRPAGKLSGGMKQKLALCCALVHKPTILFLDEPTTGVDPVSRREFWAMLKSLKSKGITIVVSTPYMDEAVLCDRVALIQNGKIMMIDTPQVIIENYRNPLYEIKAEGLYSLINTLKENPSVYSCYAFGQTAHLTLNIGVDIKDVMMGVNATATPIKATIEDCFIYLMKRNESN